jgi:hypothetical protein
MQELQLLILKHEENEEVLLEKYSDKKVLVMLELVQTDLLLEKVVELYSDQEITETLHLG